MNINKLTKTILCLIFLAAGSASQVRSAAAQQTPVTTTTTTTTATSGTQSAAPKTGPGTATAGQGGVQKSVEVPPTPTATSSTGGDNADQGKTDAVEEKVTPTPKVNRHETIAEDEAAVVPYYNNFLSSYRIGPEDVISVSVFGLERYSKGGITVPPDGRISYPLIPEGVVVVGKTTQQLQNELVKKLDEYIIDPKVTVTLDQARSARYSILGDVRAPGVRPMLRRLTVNEALAEAGGVLETGSKKKVVVLRRQTDGNLAQIPVNISAIEKGRAADIVYLVPGDQVVVPGNTLKTVKTVLSFASVISFARIFTAIF
ncbi:MAG TPA: polysaccharide biosynthesis/export family protein [Pyrinomonadaceae bacterium]|nr:polysaccharide biosynthesis/export family protein [Pyrinomonadaceae bacterium]